MEDTHVFPGLYAYSFRVDINEDNAIINSFITHYKVKYFICGFELSEKNKPHYQCILWFDKKQDSSKLRNWWKGKTLPTKQPVSFTSAKKIESLAKYAMKDAQFLTNLTPIDIKKIGKWKKKIKSTEWSDLVDAHMKQFTKTLIEKDPDESHLSCYLESCSISLLEFYKKHHRKPIRSHIQYILWKHSYITSYKLQFDWFH